MADKILYDKTSLGDTARNRSSTIPHKANIDLFPDQLILNCGKIEIRSDGTPQHTHIFIDGKPAMGIYSLKINLNTQRPTKIELGVFMDLFEFEVKPRREER